MKQTFTSSYNMDYSTQIRALLLLHISFSTNCCRMSFGSTQNYSRLIFWF